MVSGRGQGTRPKLQPQTEVAASLPTIIGLLFVNSLRCITADKYLINLSTEQLCCSSGLPLMLCGVVCRGGLVSCGCRFRSVLTVVPDMPPVAFVLGVVHFCFLCGVRVVVVAALDLLLGGFLRRGDL